MRGNPNVWLAGPEAAQHFDPARLTDAERDRWARLRRATRRQEFAVSRALCAYVHGADSRPLSESLSHTGGGYAALAQAHPALRVGVDLEFHRARDLLATARTAFSQSEASALENAAGAERERLFYAMWTVKEALAKALRLPLLEALRSCELKLDGPSWLVRIPVSEPGRIAVYQPRPELTLAVACLAPQGEVDHLDAELPIETWNWPPQQPATWPLIAAISLSAAGAPAAADRESADAARAAARA
jgi:hypothetical protein